MRERRGPTEEARAALERSRTELFEALEQLQRRMTRWTRRPSWAPTGARGWMVGLFVAGLLVGALTGPRRERT